MIKSCEQWERVHYSILDALKLVNPTLFVEKFYLSEEIDKVVEIISAYLHFKHLKLLAPSQAEIEQLGVIESNRLKLH